MAVENLMDLVPERIRDFETVEGGIVHVLYPRFTVKPLRWLMPRIRRPYIRVRLDEFGSRVWEGIDGSSTVHEIAVRTAERLGQDAGEDWHMRTAAFVRALRHGDLIRWAR